MSLLNNIFIWFYLVSRIVIMHIITSTIRPAHVLDSYELITSTLHKISYYGWICGILQCNMWRENDMCMHSMGATRFTT